MLPKSARQLISHLPRGKGMIARRIAKHGHLQIVDMVGPLDGLQMYLDLSDQFQAEMSIGAYAPDLLKELSCLVRPGDIVLTAGAHVGYMMLAMAKLGARVIGFECDPNLVETCQKNLDLNALDTTLVPVGLGSEESTLEMNISRHPGQSSFSIPHYLDSKVKVKVRRGDDVLRELGVDRLDGLLIDVEGWECHLLKGLSVRPRWAIVECFEAALNEAGSSTQELRSILTGYGLTIRENGTDLICYTLL